MLLIEFPLTKLLILGLIWPGEILGKDKVPMYKLPTKYHFNLTEKPENYDY